MKPIPTISVMFFLGVIILLATNLNKATNTFCVNNTKQLAALFPKSVDEIKKNEALIVSIIDNTVNQIVGITNNQRSFANTAQALDDITKQIMPLLGGIEALQYLSPVDELRESAQAALLRVQNHINTKISLNKNLYLSLKHYAKHQEAIGEDLTEDQKYFIDETMADFRRHGLGLPDEELKAVEGLTNQISKACQEFGINIANDKSVFTANKQELAGLDEDFIKSLKKDADNNFILGCDYPTYFNVMENSSIEGTRKKMWAMFSNRAYPKNIDVLQKVIEMRHDLAKKLGFKSYAHLDLDNQMVKTPERAKEFLMGVAKAAMPKAQKEADIWAQDLPEGVKLVKGKFKPWDITYVHSQYKKKHFSLDERKISEYFPLEHTIDQLLNVYEEFLDIRLIKKGPMPGAWHEEVQLVEVYQKNSDSPVGYLLLDLFPRPNKFSHAAQFTVIPAVDDINNCPAVAVVMANFPRKKGDKPALLTRSDVRTFFHEFGHALHALFGRTKLASFSGTNVKTDFVELPSQMLEGWVKDAGILQKISKHYQTGEPLPKETIDTITKLEKLSIGTDTTRQLQFGNLALNYFGETIPTSLHDTCKQAFEAANPNLLWDDNNHFYASFGHLTDYGAKYYGYMWSNVFAKDLFSHIKKQGLLNPKIGTEYTAKVIGQGGQKDPNLLLEDFLGRTPSQDAFMNDFEIN